jgi:hypothetical protein
MKKSRVIPALSLGLFIALLWKDKLTPLVFMGKSFEWRSLPIKLIILAIYVIIFSAIFLLIFRWLLPKRWDSLFERYYYLLIPIYSTPLIAHMILGVYSRFYTDDFCSAAEARTRGLIKAIQYWYLNWSGRFSAHMYDAITGILGPRFSPYSTFFIILIWSIVLTGVIIRLKVKEKGQRKVENIFESILLALLAIFTTLEVSPALYQSLDWGQGMHSLVPPLILATLLIGIYKWFFTKGVQNIGKKLLRFIGVGLIIIIAGGFAETYAALQVFLFSLALIIILLFSANVKRKAFPYIVMGLIFALLSMALVILAPGNKFRQGNSPLTPNLLNLYFISTGSTFSYLIHILGKESALINLLGVFLSSIALGSGLIFKTFEFQESFGLGNQVKKMFLALLIIYPAIFVCFVPAAYGLSTSPPFRTMIIPTYIVVCFLVYMGYQLGRIFGYVYLRHSAHKSFSWTLELISNFVIIAFSLNAIHSTRNNIYKIPEYNAFAEQWDSVDNMILHQKNNGERSISIPVVKSPDAGLASVSAVEFFRKCESDYYGVQIIFRSENPQ